MKLGEIIPVVGGLLQFGVAICALNLGRRLKSARAAWLLFSGLTMFALALILIPWNPISGYIEWRVEAGTLAGLSCILLMIGATHFDNRVKVLLQSSPAQNAPAAQLEPEPAPEPEPQPAESTEAPAAEQETIARLEEELAQSKQTLAGLEQNILELRADTQRWIRANDELRQSLAALEAERSEQNRLQALAEQQHQEQLAASRQAGMAEATAPVVAHLRDALNRVHSLSLTAEHLAKTRVAPIVQISRTKPSPVIKSAAAPTGKSRGRKPAGSRAPASPQPGRAPAPNHLPWIARELSADQLQLQRKIDGVKRKLEALNESLAIQQIMDKLTRAAGGEALPNPAPAEGADAPAFPAEPPSDLAMADNPPPADSFEETVAEPPAEPVVEASADSMSEPASDPPVEPPQDPATELTAEPVPGESASADPAAAEPAPAVTL